MSNLKKKVQILLGILLVGIVTVILLYVISGKVGLLSHKKEAFQNKNLTSSSEYNYNSTLDNIEIETAETQLSVDPEIEENNSTTYTPNE